METAGEREALAEKTKQLADEFMQACVGMSHGRREIMECKEIEDRLHASIDALAAGAHQPPEPAELPPLAGPPFAVYDEFGKPADDRIQDYARSYGLTCAIAFAPPGQITDADIKWAQKHAAIAAPKTTPQDAELLGKQP